MRRLKAPRSAGGMNELSSCSTLTASLRSLAPSSLGQAEPVAAPQDVGVDRESGQPEGHAADHVAGLAPDSGQR